MFHPKFPTKGEQTTECPMLAFHDAEVQTYLRAYWLSKRFHTLPRSGGLDNQLARDLEAFDVIDAAMAEEMKE